MKCVFPNWSAPNNIRAFTSTRQGGVSCPPYDTLNLGDHVNDNVNHVIENRRRIVKQQQIPCNPVWLNQTHSTNVIDISDMSNNISNDEAIANTDASYTNQANRVSVVLTADCLPILFCTTAGDEVAAAHAGWRGLCNGVIENTVSQFKCPHSKIIAWLGPAIGPEKFEVGYEVKQQFMVNDSNASLAFTSVDTKNQKYLANLYLLAKQRLTRLGINQIYGGEYCTYTQDDLFYSYRRNQCTGRMASMIWFEE